MRVPKGKTVYIRGKKYEAGKDCPLDLTEKKPAAKKAKDESAGTSGTGSSANVGK